ncbi:MAG TPA: DUF503 domain-containing protein, partial [Spirochaetales bacterium]|nr:DUF503 domain-containing protein [Spirochaetales bacterium]
MVVSMFQVILELPEAGTIKDKRRVVNSVKDRLRSRFMLSCAEVDLQDSLSFAHLGAAIVSNSAEFGEKVLHKAIDSIENNFNLRIH